MLQPTEPQGQGSFVHNLSPSGHIPVSGPLQILFLLFGIHFFYVFKQFFILQI